MISNKQTGYPKDRFPDLKGDSFDCNICLQVCVDPKECIKCGTMFCGPCIDDWISRRNECPLGCTDARNSIKTVGGALAKIYRNLDIKCQYPECGKIVKLCDIQQHEALCQLPKCKFNDICGNHVKPEFKDQGVCSVTCSFLKKIQEANGNWKLVYDEIKNIAKMPTSISNNNNSMMVKSGGKQVTFKWDSTKLGQGIEISNNGKACFLKENSYMFRSVISDTPLMDGIHYWEIVADSRTENELKIGVSMKRDFNYNTAFCDHDFGFAYYGLGQLRHGSNSVGGVYGKKFKKTGVLGVCLDMTKGILSFSLDGEYMGEAFKSEALKKGPAFAAVSLLHHAGCVLETGKPVPAYFLKN